MRIAVLGPLDVLTDDDRPLAVTGAAERSLLAVLASAAPRVVPVERLIEVLPGGAGEPAEKSLRAALRGLRAALEPGLPERSSGQYVLRRGAGYALVVGPGDLDALRFDGLVRRGRAALAAGDAAHAERTLTTALDLWRGDPYADWPDAAFARAERRRLTAVRRDASAALDEARRSPRTDPVADPFAAPSPPPAPPVLLPAPPLPAPPRAELRTDVGPVEEARPDVLRAPPLRSAPASRRLALIAALVAALVAAALAGWSRPGRVDATPGPTVADARRGPTAVDREPLDIALLVAVDAVRRENSYDHRERLLAGLWALGRVERVVPFPGLPESPALSGGRVLTFRNDRTVLAWTADPSTQPDVLMPVPGEWGAWYVTAPSPAEPVLLAAGENMAGPWLRTVSTLDGTSRLLAGGPELPGRPVDAAVTPDGRRAFVVLAEPSDVARWRLLEVDLHTGSPRDTGVRGVVPAAADALAADFSDDAGTLVVWDVTRAAPATLVDVASGRQSTVEEHAGPGASTGFRALPSGAAQFWNRGGITLVDDRGRFVQDLAAHDGQVRDVVVAPDGTWAATAGDGPGLVRWAVDPATGKWSDPEDLTGHVGSVIGVETDPGGRRLFTVSLDNRVIVWDMRDRGGVRENRARRFPVLDASVHVAEACDVVQRDLTPGEAKTYLPGREHRPTCTDLP